MSSTQHAVFSAAASPFVSSGVACVDAHIPESAVIERAQRGDASAFEGIYRRHSPRVFAVCLRIVGNIAAAEDLTQEAFLLVLRKIRSFRGDSAFSTWLHRIAVNVSLMRLRRNPPRELSLENSAGAHDEPSQFSAQLASADAHLSSSLDRLHLERAIARLRPSQKLVVVLHDIQGYKHSEIASMLDWSIGNSKSHLHRARSRLRELLTDSSVPPDHKPAPPFQSHSRATGALYPSTQSL
jgi:RNA polymerase sigma-70 factor (ECF subfamily)